MHTKGYYSVIKWNEVPVQTIIWVNLKNTVLSKEILHKRIQSTQIIYKNSRTGKTDLWWENVRQMIAS